MQDDTITVLLIEDNDDHVQFRQLLASSAAGQFELHTSNT